MSKDKLKVIENSADDYKKLPKDKQMFVLGYMQGVLSSQQEKEVADSNKQLAGV